MLQEKRKCDICGSKAVYDAKTVFGPWAYLCEDHFNILGLGLGLGKGQRIVYIRR